MGSNPTTPTKFTNGSGVASNIGRIIAAQRGATKDGKARIENVGNLVCPAIYDLGQRAKVVAMSVTEGVDKPLKHPVMFRAADLVVLTKIDLLPHLPDVDPKRIEEALGRVMPDPRLIALSARTGEGMGDWLAWLEKARAG